MTYATLESLLAHYVRMSALDPVYAMRRVRYMAERAPSLYAELPAMLTAATTAQAEPSAPASASCSPAKPSAE